MIAAYWRPILLVFLPFAAGYFLSYFFRTINAVIAGQLTAELGLDASHLGLMTSVYFLTFAAIQLPLGDQGAPDHKRRKLITPCEQCRANGSNEEQSALHSPRPKTVQ